MLGKANKERKQTLLSKLIGVLFKDNANGYSIFEALFKNRKPQLIFKFLDEETNLFEDIKYIWGCPKKPFITALLKRLF